MIDWSNASAGHPGQDVAIALADHAARSDLDIVPLFMQAWSPGSCATLLVRRFDAAATATDAGLYMADMARIRMRDLNVRPGEAARLEQTDQSQRSVVKFAGNWCV